MLYILGAIIVVLVVIVFWQTLRSRELSAGIQSLQTNLDRTRTNLATDELESNELEHQLTLLRVEVGSLKNRVESLQHYQDILDVEQYVQERRQQVEMFVEMVKSEAENMRDQCKQKIEKVSNFLVEHEQKAKAKTLKAAQEQLGAFYHLAEERQKLEQVTAALYHKIEENTPAFQLPAQQLLDHLIEDYSQSDAAQHLVQVRQKIMQAIQNNEMAYCAFVDEQRRLSAVTLLSHAFNSRADLYLAQLNQHNLGESLQALQDDFTLLNHYAASFGHSKILESYLALRLEELKFASLVIGLKQQGTDTTQQVKLAANA